MGQRWYDPAVGRFVSQDPIGFNGGLNLYGYVGQNPVNAIDPSGLAISPSPISFGQIFANVGRKFANIANSGGSLEPFEALAEIPPVAGAPVVGTTALAAPEWGMLGIGILAALKGGGGMGGMLGPDDNELDQGRLLTKPPQFELAQNFSEKASSSASLKVDKQAQ